MASVNSINEKIQNLITSAQAVTEDVSNDLTSQVSALIKGYGTGGIDTSSDTVAADKMLEGTTAHDASGEQVTGTIPTLEIERPYTITQSTDATIIPSAGKYVAEDITIMPALQNKTITENGEYTPDDGFVGLRTVTVNVESSGGVDTSTDTVTAETMLEGFTAHNAEGEPITGSIQTYDGAIQNGVVQPAVKPVEFNIAYGDTAPEDTSKLWVKTAEPNLISISANIEGTESLEVAVGNLPQKMYDHSSATVGTKIYIFGGYGTSYLNTILVFDTETEKVTTLSTTLPTACHKMSAVAVGTNIYIFGGKPSTSSYSELNTILVFDTETEEITTLSTILPNKMCRMATAAVDENIYIFGGDGGGSTYYDSILLFNTRTNAISTLGAKMPFKGYGSRAIAIGTNIYIFGGHNSSGKICVFDTETNSIRTLSATGTGLRGFGIASFGSKIYIIGASGSDSNNYDKISVFDINTEEVEDISLTLPKKSYSFSCSQCGTRVYQFGGYCNGMLSDIHAINISSPLATGDIQIQTDLFENTFPLIVSDTATLETGVKNVYVGNADGVAEKAEAYLHNGTEWVQI